MSASDVGCGQGTSQCHWEESVRADRRYWSQTLSLRRQAFTNGQLNECHSSYVTLSVLRMLSCHGSVGTDGLKSGGN